MKILITGSHFTPALAVIEELKKYQDTEIVYIGRKYTREGDKTLSLESQTLPKLGVKFIPIISGRLQRAFTIYTFPSLLKIPIGFIQSFYFLLKEKPQVILSFGGYNAIPVVICGWLLSIPIIIHEQTLVSGLANQICAFFADKIAISFSNNEFSKMNKTILTGNPIRKEITSPQPLQPQYKKLINNALKKHLPVILITGGNQGSHLINKTIAQILPELSKNACIIHQTGDSKFNDFEKLTTQKELLNNKDHYLVNKWIDVNDFGAIIAHADLVISRAGINTLLELAFVGVPTLLIPIPYLPKDEQNVNAKFFKELGLSEVIHQKDLTAENILKKINEMIKNLPQLKNQAKKAKEAIILEAAERLALETTILGNQSL